MRPSRTFSVDGKEVFVFDEVLSKRDHETLARSLLVLPYRRTQVDSKRTQDVYAYYSAHFTLEAVTRLDLFGRIERMLSAAFPRERFVLDEVYVNRNSFGDMTHIHTDDSAASGAITAVYFAHDRWEREWGGETLFFDADHDATFAVSPTPRRAIVFRGSVLHRIGVPTRQCHVSRLSMAFKFRPARPARTRRAEP